MSLKIAAHIYIYILHNQLQAYNYAFVKIVHSLSEYVRNLLFDFVQLSVYLIHLHAYVYLLVNLINMNYFPKRVDENLAKILKLFLIFSSQE